MNQAVAEGFSEPLIARFTASPTAPFSHTFAVLQQGLGPVMAKIYSTIKRQEISRHEAAEDKAQWQRREYFSRY